MFSPAVEEEPRRRRRFCHYAEAAAAVELEELLVEEVEEADLLSDPEGLDSEDPDGFGLLPVSTDDDDERESVR